MRYKWSLKNKALKSETNKKSYRRRYKYIRKWHKDYNNLHRLKLIKFLGGKCIKCNFSDYRALQVDHINGGGVKELREFGSRHPRKYLAIIKENPDKYQLLCANCNWIKKYEKNEIVKTSLEYVAPDYKSKMYEAIGQKISNTKLKKEHKLGEALDFNTD